MLIDEAHHVAQRPVEGFGFGPAGEVRGDGISKVIFPSRSMITTASEIARNAATAEPALLAARLQFALEARVVRRILRRVLRFVHVRGKGLWAVSQRRWLIAKVR